MKKFFWIFIGGMFLQTACDLQPKIVSFPDTVGEFISARYPALLADPNTHPEIYNSAVTDYGIYASPELYGSLSDDDYLMYASVDDYIVPPQSQESTVKSQSKTDDVVQSDDYLTVPRYTSQADNIASSGVYIVRAGDTLYSIAKKHNMSVDDIAQINSMEKPYALSVGQKLSLKKEIEKQSEPLQKDENDVLEIKRPVNGIKTVTKVGVNVITVASGDTLYSLSRKYSVPVNDLAIMNNLSVPFNLYVGQKLRVPNLSNAPIASVSVDNAKQQKAKGVSVEKKQDSVPDRTGVKTTQAPVKKISSDPNKKLPKITGRSSSKFSWPVRGKVLSNYGAKSNGLFNDGMNISAARGTDVKAAENGVVAYAGNEVKGMGNLVIIQHDAGWMTVYAHMDSMNVKRGAKVGVGQKIGTVGETGKVDRPQLHFEIRKGTKAYDPSLYLKK